MTNFQEHLKNSGCYVKKSDHSYLRVVDDGPKLRQMQKPAETPLTMPKINFGNQANAESSECNCEQLLIMPKITFGNRANTEIVRVTKNGETPLIMPRINF